MQEKLEKDIEITRAIYSNGERPEQFLKQNSLLNHSLMNEILLQKCNQFTKIFFLH